MLGAQSGAADLRVRERGPATGHRAGAYSPECGRRDSHRGGDRRGAGPAGGPAAWAPDQRPPRRYADPRRNSLSNALTLLRDRPRPSPGAGSRRRCGSVACRQPQAHCASYRPCRRGCASGTTYFHAEPTAGRLAAGRQGARVLGGQGRVHGSAGKSGHSVRAGAGRAGRDGAHPRHAGARRSDARRSGARYAGPVFSAGSACRRLASDSAAHAPRPSVRRHGRRARVLILPARTLCRPARSTGLSLPLHPPSLLPE